MAQSYSAKLDTYLLRLATGASAIAMIGAAQPAFAQDTAAPEAQTSTASDDNTTIDPADADAIIVTGIRASLERAQDIKRNSDTVVDAITAEDIGALPDRSVNEAIQRVPGVAISRFAAPNDSQHFSVEGSGVVIRGLSYVKGEFNSRDTFAANAGREIGFNDVPTELVGSIEVFKNLTADRIEGGISGTVNINTRKPFDSKERLIYLSASMNYGDFAERGAPSGVALFSDQWEFSGGGRFGLLASASYSQQYSRSDSVFIASPFPRYNDDTNGNGVQDAGEGRVLNQGTPYQSTVFDTFPVPDGRDFVYVPTGGGSRTQDFNRERIGFSAAAQYENADGSLLVTAQFLRSDAREAWLEHTEEPNVYYGDVTATFPAPGTDFTYDDNGVFTSGTLVHSGGVPFGNKPSGCVIPNDGNPYTTTYCPLDQFIAGGQFTTFSNRFFYTKSVTQDQSLNIKWEPTERLHINLDGQYVNSNAENVDDIVDAATFANANIDLRGKVPKVTEVTPGFDTDEYFADPHRLYLRDAFNNRAINDGHEWAFRGDAEYDLSDTNFLRKVRVGARYSDRQQTIRTNDYNNWGAVSDTWTANGPTYFDSLPAAASQSFSYVNFFRGDAVTPPTTTYIDPNILSHHDALEDLLRQATLQAGGNYIPLEDRGTDLVKGYFRPNEIYDNSEKTWGGYARLDFGTDSDSGINISGNIGVRYVHTDDESQGALTFPIATTVLPVDNNVDPDGNPLPPRFNSIATYCAFTIAQQAMNPNPNNLLPVICTITPDQQAAALAFANGASLPNTARNSFDNWLPSLNVRLELTPKLQMRFAASRAISRPNFGSLRNYTGVNVSGANTAGNFGFSGQSQNPFLKPIKATQFDLTAEWYFSKLGSLTGAVFYKDLSDIILDNSGYTRTVTNNGQTFDVQVNGPANAPGHAHLKGVEIGYQQTFDFLPGLLRGLGTQATFTYVDPGKIPNATPANGPADGNRPPQDVGGLYDNLPITGLSKYNYNVSAFYDLGGLYARVAYSWRSKYLLTTRDCCFPFLPVYALASGQTDASLYYTVDKHLKLGIEVQNLLDATTKTAFVYTADGLTAPRSVFKSDRQFQISARMSF